MSEYERPDLNQTPVLDGELLEGESAVARAERVFSEAYAAGFQQGESAALAQFQQQVGEAHSALESAALALQQAHAAFLDSLEPQLVELAKVMASKILPREATTDDELVRRTARAAMENLTERQLAIVHLNPDDIAGLTQRGVSIEAEFQSFERVEIVPDDAVPRGGCTVETKTVDVDARLDTQLARIFDALEE